jgi:hypothetical protein
MREGLPLPKAIASAPQLMLGLELYFDAFFDLSTCRSMGFSMGPIPWSAMRDYALAFEFSEEQAEDLFHYVRVMDIEYMKHHAPKKGGKKWQSQGASDSSQGAWPSARNK